MDQITRMTYVAISVDLLKDLIRIALCGEPYTPEVDVVLNEAMALLPTDERAELQAE